MPSARDGANELGRDECIPTHPVLNVLGQEESELRLTNFIVFGSDFEAQFDLWRLDVNTLELVQLTNDFEIDALPD